MGRRNTEQDYHALAKKRDFKWVDSLPKYAKDKTLWRCSQGHEWKVSYISIRVGKGCPHCYGNAKKIEQDYHDLAQSHEFKWLGPYPKNVNAMTCWQCQDGHKWEASFNRIYSGRGCKKCYENKRRKSSQDYHGLAKTCGIKWVGKLPKNANHKTLWQCHKGHRWGATYSNIYFGTNCPDCHNYKGPNLIAKILTAMGVHFETEKRFNSCKHKRPLPFDFYIPAANLLIEYQGEHHFKSIWGPLSNVKRNDKIKADWADQSPYELLYINYWQYDRIVEILADRLGSTNKHDLRNPS